MLTKGQSLFLYSYLFSCVPHCCTFSRYWSGRISSSHNALLLFYFFCSLTWGAIWFQPKSVSERESNTTISCTNNVRNKPHTVQWFRIQKHLQSELLSSCSCFHWFLLGSRFSFSQHYWLTQPDSTGTLEEKGSSNRQVTV